MCCSHALCLQDVFIFLSVTVFLGMLESLFFNLSYRSDSAEYF